MLDAVAALFSFAEFERFAEAKSIRSRLRMQITAKSVRLSSRAIRAEIMRSASFSTNSIPSV
jgi:hypothetical protein